MKVKKIKSYDQSSLGGSCPAAVGLGESLSTGTLTVRYLRMFWVVPVLAYFFDSYCLMLTVDVIGAKSAVVAMYSMYAAYVRCGCAAYEELRLTTPGQPPGWNIWNKERLLL
jgi:hypothetical protein